MYNNDDIRDFMEIALNYINEPSPVLTEDVVPFANKEEDSLTANLSLLSDLSLLADKMRNHREDDPNEDIAMGVETGLLRAADMIDNLVRRYEEKQ